MNQLLMNILGSLFKLFQVIFLVLVGYWVYLDATERGSNANYLWAIGCTVFSPLIIGYLLYRSQIGGRTESAGVKERFVGTFVIGHFIALWLWSILRLINVIGAPFYPPVVVLQYYLTLFLMGVIPGYWLVWKRGWARTRRRIGWIQESERTDAQT